MEVLLIEPTWTSPYLAYILQQRVPTNPVEAKRVIRRSKGFTVINGELYKRSISGESGGLPGGRRTSAEMVVVVGTGICNPWHPDKQVVGAPMMKLDWSVVEEADAAAGVSQGTSPLHI